MRSYLFIGGGKDGFNIHVAPERARTKPFALVGFHRSTAAVAQAD